MKSTYLAVTVLFALSAVIMAGCQNIGSTDGSTAVSSSKNTLSGNVISGYKSMMSASGRRRNGSHAGIDFGGKIGDPVIAAADGYVTTERRSKKTPGCGYGVVIFHPQLDLYTAYCHLNEIIMRSGESVKRGKVIGYVGITGLRHNTPHVHFEVSTDGDSHRDGDTRMTRNPTTYLSGCFRPSEEGLLENTKLTEPLQC